ncbi:hypothetical protein CEXT_484051 [Caerostris extrusa]|uniref:Uncharacterized protein n=1 Tax=Caerostris extrusa TaxID=172846 RepID=A0AAV4U622_CAEEX|nr:hypothetical protein CEXT_484051 [Caerostris extrusa]
MEYYIQSNSSGDPHSPQPLGLPSIPFVPTQRTNGGGGDAKKGVVGTVLDIYVKIFRIYTGGEIVINCSFLTQGVRVAAKGQPPIDTPPTGVKKEHRPKSLSVIHSSPLNSKWYLGWPFSERKLSVLK